MIYFSDYEKDIHRVEIFNLFGQRISVVRSANTLDLQAFVSGFYLLKIHTSEGIVTKKIIKQ
ncbi:T9SS type A sorting domain-containing protein [Lacinutrix neustonica]|uniref:T9SS type A sorting domain-containing protein n=1 Tax=Lacinutrix neustonica TaxID=2980107 RepID=UPI0036F262D7